MVVDDGGEDVPVDDESLVDVDLEEVRLEDNLLVDGDWEGVRVHDNEKVLLLDVVTGGVVLGKLKVVVDPVTVGL